MSKKRNRNIRHKFDPALTNNHHKQELMTTDSKRVTCFGEPVSSHCQEARHFLGNKFWEQISDFYCCIGDRVLENANDVSVDKSSSSSLSWGEECEIESTRSVQREYDRMTKVLQGIEDIPPNYNKDEYKLWIKTFPCLRSTDTRPRPRNRIRFSEELTVKNAYCDKSETMPCDIVINDVFGEPITDSYSSRKSRKRSCENRSRSKLGENALKSLEIDFENFLRISPAPTSTRPLRTSRRYNNEHSPEFVSLPYLPVVQREVPRDLSAKTRISTINRRKKFAIELELVPPNNNNLILPPINNTQSRSVSAVHLQPNVRSSATSTKTNLNAKVTNRIEVIGLNNNRLLKRNSENKSIKRYCCN